MTIRADEIRAHTTVGFWTVERPCEQALAELVDAYNRLADKWTDLHARVALLEQVAEAAREAEHWLMMPSDTLPKHVARLGEVRRDLQSALSRLAEAEQADA